MYQKKYFYAVCTSPACGIFEDLRLSDCGDRHRIILMPPILSPSNQLLRDALQAKVDGLVIEIVYGWVNRQHLKLAKAALRKNLKVWFYWPREQAVEFIDDERHASHFRLWAFVKLVDFACSMRMRLHQLFIRYVPQKIRPSLKAFLIRAKLLQSRLFSATNTQLAKTSSIDISKRLALEYRQLIDRLISLTKLQPIEFSQSENAQPCVSGMGIYLRTDFWAPIKTGGSYGHTCYVAKELAASTDELVCFMANRFALLDEMGLEQRVMPAPSPTGDELSLIRANDFFYDLLFREFSNRKPAYIYERLCLGNFVGARLSQEFSIPYIVEYNGSEISMRRSFDSGNFEYENFFLKAEELAFKQATIVSVISEAVRQDLLRRGISDSKILVNPNGVDLNAYAPLSDEKRSLLRKELGFAATDRVVGFIGTFGGWHGIDVLAEALPLICSRDQHIKFLLIGDGNFKHLTDQSIKRNRLEDRVICTGRVPHTRGAELLGACDIYASPHSSHMVDSRFFGSPTKLFEYMAMGGGIVGSDLEQIGEVLSPALHAIHHSDTHEITHERSVLCTPGDVREFIEAVIFLAKHPQVSKLLGRNARLAAEREFSWHSHVARLWKFAAESEASRKL